VKKTVAGVIGVVLFASAITLGAMPAQAATDSAGRTCTITGTSASNRLIGTSGDDVICGLGGNDFIDGLGGNDFIDGGAGDDTIIDGSGGNDLIDGGAGDDVIMGGPGDDKISGGAGANIEYGGTGDDTLTGGTANDRITGQEGDDTIVGGSGNDALYGGSGDDRLEGNAGNDLLQGDAGSDGLIGGAGSDTLRGGIDGQTTPDTGDLCEPAAVGDVTSACGFDAQAPHILSYTLSSSTINTSAAAQTVTIDVRVTDDLLGVSKLNCAVQLQGQTGITLPAYGSLFPVSTFVSGTGLDGVTRCSIVFPKSTPQGIWLINIEAYDSAGQSESLSAYNELAWAGRFGQADAGTITQTGAGDAQAPLIRAVTFNRTSINTEGAFVNPRPGTAFGNTAVANARIVDITMDVSDDLAGIKMVQCGLRFQNDPYGSVVTATKVSGTALRSVWKCSVRMADFSPQGSWYLVATVADLVGHTKNLRGVSSGVNEAFNGASLESSEETSLGRNYVTQTGRGDDTAPVVSSFSVTPTTVNTSAAAKTIVHTFNLTDNVSGVQSVSCSLSHTITVGNSSTTTSGQIYSGKLVSGTRFNGVWTCSAVLPKGSARGEWSLNWWALDVARNQKAFSGNGGAQNGWSGSGLSDAERALPFISVTNG
jgi:hypothetical protein